MDLSVTERAVQQPVESMWYRPSDAWTDMALDSDVDDPIVHRVLAHDSDLGFVAVAAFNSAV
jgi:hypothetical protein